MEEKQIYTCPMHPDVISDTPGLCPECGMQLIPSSFSKGGGAKGDGGFAGENCSDSHACCADEVAGQLSSFSKGGGAKGDGGFEKSLPQKSLTASGPLPFVKGEDKHKGHKTNIFKAKFWVSLVLTIPVVLYSDIGMKVFKISMPEFTGSEYLPLILSSIVFFYGGWIFIIGGWREVRARLPGMMTLISIAIIAAYVYSVYAVFAQKEALFWELTTLITIMLLGHWMEMRAVTGAQGALKELSKLLPDTAERIKNKETEIVSLSELKESDIVVVRPGGKIPADGEIIDGHSDVNESMVTGESRPVKKEKGNKVIAGTINGDGNIHIKVTGIGEKTFLSGIMRLIQQAQASKSRLQILSDRAAYWLTFIAIGVGAITFISWIVGAGDVAMATERFVAVLVITCPHALGLAVPLVASISTTLGARSGVLVKQRMALEASRNIDIVLFDKTGTLTKGEYGLIKMWAMGGKNEQEVLKLAASVDAKSEHFIAQAIVTAAKSKDLRLYPVERFERVAGKGVAGVVGGKKILVGGEAIAQQAIAALSTEKKSEVKTEAKKGATIIYIIEEGQLIGVLALADVIRPESKQAVADLKQLGIKAAMITGDSEDVAEWVAKELGLDYYFARVLPADKADMVRKIQSGEIENWKLKIGNSSRRLAVAMVGDGINDAPALTQADVGIAIGAGTNVAIESAGIILVKSDPRDIVKIIKLSRATYRKMVQNLWWATGYNVVAIPLAAGALVAYGIVLSPAIAALLMSVSTVVVACNALLLRRSLS